MAPRSRGIERTIGASLFPLRSQHICRSCKHALTRRNYAAAATAEASTDSDVPLSIQHTTLHPSPAEHVRPEQFINASVVLSRPPLITPDPHPFETSYYLYQRRLNERLVLPFTQYFYYKRGSPAFEEWRKRKAERGGVATRDIGNYNAYTKESWNDEILIGDQSGSPQTVLEQLVDEEGRATEFTPEGGDTKSSGLRRTTPADDINDQRSLERSLSRTLYLLVNTGKKTGKETQKWIFPTGKLEAKEGLKEAAKRVLDSTCGVNMNTWFVGSHPVGYLVKSSNKLAGKQTTRPGAKQNDIRGPQQGLGQESPAGGMTLASEDLSNNSASSEAAKTEITTDQSEKSQAMKVEPEASSRETQTEQIEKTFFMKARIFAGQADVHQELKAYHDFKWLSKEEIQQKVDPHYWSKIQDMLVAQ